MRPNTWLLSLSLCLSVFGLNGCQSESTTGRHTVVVAIEGLDFESAACVLESESSLSGFNQLCREAVRFSHAYTPSVMSQAAFASLLTGLYPFEHGVRNNGADYLREEFETVAEVAFEKGLRTGFFSGGAPILRKSGFAQGFEVFDDNIDLRSGRYHISAKEVVGKFLRWQQKEVLRRPSLSVLYFNDLLYASEPTTNEDGLPQSLSRESRLQVIDSALQDLAVSLRGQKQWDQTLLVVLGLNGRSRPDRSEEFLGANILSDNSHVALIVKPARRSGDEGTHWSIDANVSLVDMGRTLLGVDAPSGDRLGSVSLSQSIQRPRVDWRKDRIVFTESAWSQWTSSGTSRYAARIEDLLYLIEKPMKLFNTLMDQSELNPTPVKPAAALALLDELKAKVPDLAKDLEQFYETWILEKIRLGRAIYERGTVSDSDWERLQRLRDRYPHDVDLREWALQRHLAKEDWRTIRAEKDQWDSPLWAVAAGQILGSDRVDLMPFLAASRLPLVQDFYGWIKAAELNSAPSLLFRFAKRYQYRSLDRDVRRINYLNGIVFHTSDDSTMDLDLIDLLLRLPEFKKYRGPLDGTLNNLK
jgi:hypothetical protein